MDELNLREATPGDIPILVKHRRGMFEEMLSVQPVNYTWDDLEAMEPAYQRYLEQQLGEALRAWVVEVNGAVVASGALIFYDWPPRPGHLTGRMVVLQSVYTAPPYRRQGLARQLLNTLIGVCRELGLPWVMLHASDAGRPLYAALGFKATSEMRLVLD